LGQPKPGTKKKRREKAAKRVVVNAIIGLVRLPVPGGCVWEGFFAKEKTLKQHPRGPKEDQGENSGGPNPTANSRKQMYEEDEDDEVRNKGSRKKRQYQWGLETMKSNLANIKGAG